MARAKAAKAARADSRLAGLDGFVRRRMRDWDVPGAAVGVVERGRVIYAKGFGVCDVKRDAPVTEDTPFYIASCTKAFTATAVGMLVEEGKLAWDTPVREYIPSFRLQDRLAGERITARDLLTHRSGLPRHDLLWLNSSATRAELCRRLRYLEPSRDFRSLYQYSNLMYMLAGWLVETVSGLTWEEFVRERIFAPLGMETSGFITDTELPAGTPAVGHVKDGRRVVHWDRGRPSDARMPSAADPVGPCGSIVSTVSDMCRWLRLQMNGGRVGRRSLVSKETLREIHSPHVVVPEPRLGSELSDPCYGLGWSVQSYRGRQWIHHTGGFAGFAAKASFMPEDGTGVMLVSNLADNPLNIAVPLHIYDRLLGLEPVPWNARIKRLTKQAEAEAAKAKRRRRAKKTRPSHALREYAGRYRHAGYGELAVAIEGGRLRLTYNGLTYPVKHRQADVFEVGEIWGAPLEASFGSGGDGRIESVAIPLEPAVAPIVFGRV